MVATGMTGLAAAFFIYALLLNATIFTNTCQILYDVNCTTKQPSAIYLLTYHGNKHFGLGKCIVTATFIQLHLSSRITIPSKTTSNLSQSHAFLITNSPSAIWRHPPVPCFAQQSTRRTPHRVHAQQEHCQ